MNGLGRTAAVVSTGGLIQIASEYVRMRKLQDQKFLIVESVEGVPCELSRWMLVVVDVWLRS
jgi:hypothetical protein